MLGFLPSLATISFLTVDIIVQGICVLLKLEISTYLALDVSFSHCLNELDFFFSKNNAVALRFFLKNVMNADCCHLIVVCGGTVMMTRKAV